MWISSRSIIMTGVKHQCPLCSVSLCNIPRHLKETHHILSTSPVYNYLCKFKQSKPNNGVEYLLYRCPVENCTSPLLKRLDKHLKNIHAIRCGTPEYDAELRKSNLPGMIVRVSDSDSDSDTRSAPKHTSPASSQDETCQDGDDEAIEAVDVDHNEEDAEEASNGVDFNISISDGASKVSSERIGTVELPSYVDDHLKSFRAWLGSINGGQRSVSHAIQYSRHVRCFLSHSGIDFSTKFAVREALKNASCTFIEHSLHAKKITASTITNYLASVRHFCDWHTLANNHTETFMTDLARDLIILQIEQWRKGLQKQKKVREHLVRKESTDKMVPVEIFKAFLSSTRVSEAHTMYDKLASGKKQAHRTPRAQMTFFTHMRNYIIMKIILGNVPRSGVLINMTLAEIKKGGKEVFEDTVVINVKDHKTRGTYGPCQISLPVQDFKYLEVYIAKIRRTGKKKHKNLFLTFNGSRLSSSAITNIITQELLKTSETCINPGRICTTNVRKSIVSLFSSQHLGVDAERDLAKMMKHSVGVQQSYYNISRIDPDMARTSKVVMHLFDNETLSAEELSRFEREDEGVREESNEENADEDKPVLNDDSSFEDDQDELPPRRKTKPARFADYVPDKTRTKDVEEEVTPQKDVVEARVTLRMRTSLLFENEIKDGSIKIARVREVLKGNPSLRIECGILGATAHRGFDKIVCDCIRTQFK